MCGDTCSSPFTFQSWHSLQPCSMQQGKGERLLHGREAAQGWWCLAALTPGCCRAERIAGSAGLWDSSTRCPPQPVSPTGGGGPAERASDGIC